MKNLLLIMPVCLCIAFTAAAQTSNTTSANQEFKLERKIKLIPADDKQHVSLGQALLKQQQQEAKLQQSTGGAFRAFESRRLTEDAGNKLDSIIARIVDDGENYTRQNFEYDEQGRPTVAYNYNWDGEQWSPYSTYEYVWDDGGLCLEYIELYLGSSPYGYRYVRTYDVNDNITSLIYYYSSDGETWEPQQKAEYEYDQWGNCTADISSYYDTYSETPGWVYSDKFEAAWDEQGRQTMGCQMYWNGEQWIGYSWNDKYEYQYDEQGRMQTYYRYIWDDDLGDWFKYYRDNYTYSGDVLAQEDQEYWNKTSQSWEGQEYYNWETCYNTRIEYLRDNQQRDTLQRITALIDGEWLLRGRYTNEYTDLADGNTERLNTIIYYRIDEDGNDLVIPVYKYYYLYNPVGNILHEVDYRYYNNTRWIITEEDSATYTHNGTKTDEVWMWYYTTDDPQVRINNVYGHYEYDANGNNTGGILMSGGGASDPTSWYNSTRFTKVWEQDSILVSQVFDTWDGSDWIYNEELTYTLDYTVPLDELISWVDFPTVEKMWHKVLTKRNKTAWSEAIDYTYYYSHMTPSGIDETLDKAGHVGVYPNPTTDVLNIAADGDVEVNIYDLCGQQVVNTTSKTIDVSGLAQGVYLVNVNGTVTKVIKR